jgi:hypothetical protein
VPLSDAELALIVRRGADELGVLDDAAHVHRLAWLEVDSDPDNQLGVAVDPADRYGVDGHSRRATPPR